MTFSRQIQLSVIVPTYNERESIGPLIISLAVVLEGIDWEVIVVDDNSADGTAEYVRELAESDGRVRCIQRIGRRGLASAVMEGFLASSAVMIAVMDADGQHDERLLVQMFEKLRQNAADIVVGSRYLAEGSTGSLATSRVGMSRVATRLASWLMATSITDPMSGFFMFRRTALVPVFGKLSAQGFKILLDMIVSGGRALRIIELPYEMRSRVQGESKLDVFVAFEFILYLIDKLIGRWVPLRFLMFAAVGTTGVVVHAVALLVFHKQLELAFISSQALATVVAMTSNFLINNIFTYRDQRLHGVGLLRGLLSFYLACSIGALLNVQFASLLYESQGAWLFAGICGALVGAVWNYAMTKTFTWNGRG